MLAIFGDGIWDHARGISVPQNMTGTSSTEHTKHSFPKFPALTILSDLEFLVHIS